MQNSADTSTFTETAQSLPGETSEPVAAAEASSDLSVTVGNVGPGIAEDIDQEKSEVTDHAKAEQDALRRELARRFPAIRRLRQLGIGEADRIIPPVTLEIPMPQRVSSAHVDVAADSQIADPNLPETKNVRVVSLWDAALIDRLAVLEDEVAQLRSRLDHHGIRGPQ